MADAAMIPPWEAFADAVLHREALVCRVSHGIPVHDFAGMYVDDADVDRILRTLPGLDGPKPAQTEHLVAATTRTVERARAALHPVAHDRSPFGRIATAARLGACDVEVLALLAAVEASPARQRLVAYMQDDIALRRVTLDLLRRLFGTDHAGMSAVAPDAPLRTSRLVVVTAQGPWAAWTAHPAPRLLWALAGNHAPDPALPPGTRLVRDDAGVASAGHGDDGDDGAAGDHGDDLATGCHVGLVLVHGADRRTRRELAVDALGADRFLVGPPPVDGQQLDALVREAVIAGAAIVLEVDDALADDLRACITQVSTVAWAVSSPTPLPLDMVPDRHWTELAAPVQLVDGGQWRRALGTSDGHGHRLTPEQLDLIARATPALGGNAEAAVRRLASGQLDTLATHLVPRRGWDDLVLPHDTLAALHELASRYRHRRMIYDDWAFRALPSAGLVAVFSGPSGTGKTLAAEVIADDLGLDVYKIDLSAVVSKYIGETEKNLERIFSAAASANVVLFFDEADALFGKRSDVGDAHDRYANIEVSYLLQRLEAYDGLVVLATNLQRNMDAAFLRRIHVGVEFGLPDEAARRAIWTLSFPPAAPARELDVDFLARQFKLSGGSIRNAALGAAFLAAADAGVIEMPHVMRALKREFQKLGRLRTEAEFDRYFALVHADH